MGGIRDGEEIPRNTFSEISKKRSLIGRRGRRKEVPPRLPPLMEGFLIRTVWGGIEGEGSEIGLYNKKPHDDGGDTKTKVTIEKEKRKSVPG